ncbi:hypothetical protein N7472_003875 [Penicillium cf. griseofulvum]|uniref:Uncharacterized protein n=1 Tax=Penicillium cf. griseofulvum TaxID=2972120 RepID=A0A9W9MU35_9EURO|nr:hypothetical protein N7472_003875 [Penicillium cf. griseofulvum]KAJ5447581.1 hypothetical protein N7445_002402 [Penicillium cf. griseofulvum]
MSALILLAISLLLIVIWSKSHKSHSTSNDPSICRQIIAGVLNSTEQNVLSSNQSKAIANKHLPIAFGIDNAFTRTDSAHASMFVEKVKPLINLSAEQHSVSKFAKATTNHWIQQGFPGLGHSCSNSCHK